METMMCTRDLTRVRNSCGFTDGLCVNSRGRAGGLGLWWRDINVNLISFCNNHIMVDVLDENNSPKWRAVGIYGWPETSNKHKTWDLMRSLCNSSNIPIAFFGDFNEIVSMSEKQGGAIRRERHMDAFRSVIDDCALHDHGYRGNIFTWQRGLTEETIVRERLDRTLVTTDWQALFPNMIVQHLPIYSSDHAAILLKEESVIDRCRRRRKFKFEPFWMADEQCEGIINEAWRYGPNRDIPGRVKNCAMELSNWASQNFGNIKRRIRDKETELEQWQRHPPSTDMLDKCREIVGELDELRRQNETYWYTRARKCELRDGDKNTSYFHHKAKQRKKRNAIVGIEDANGEWCTEGSAISKVIEDYFEQLFCTSNPSDFDEGLSCIPPVITSDMNQLLDSPLCDEEIKEAMFCMHPNKAPGPDAEIISKYERASGRKINYSKSEVVFSKKVSTNVRINLVAALGVREVERHEKYLGIPTIIGRSKKAVFSCLKERVWKKVQGWKKKLLSKPGKEVLIKAVAQAIPTYMMSLFALPEGTIDEIHMTMARFWWGSTETQRKIHWWKWDRLCLPKSKGGLGFRNLRVFNQALLAKQVWRLLMNPDTLAGRVMKARYFKSCSILEARRGHDPSFVWRSLWGAKSLLKEGLQWRVGNGESIGVWEAAWVPGERGGTIPSPNIEADPSLRVEAFIDKEQGIWRDDELRRVLLAEEVRLVHKILLNKNLPPDIMYWWPNKSGIYSVKSGYWLGMGPHLEEVELAGQVGNDGLWRRLWGLPIPPKLIHFLWRACNGTLAVRVNLNRRHCCPNSHCEFCDGAEETELHALYLCQWASVQWAMSSFSVDTQLHGDEKGNFLAMVWAIWAIRNARIFEDEQRNPEVTVLGFMRLVQEYNGYMKRVGGANCPRQEIGGVQWLKPDVGVIKINTDAAVLEDGSVGLGVVARDCHGGIVTGG
ncbi:uncharacterized protein LOC141634383 [Silene latifolia]|uniref:uncharacterized protein LOC141634383 n=1 Tax=Silene latifolia TaxID=37657 RepID=UPI003D77F0E6